MSNASLTDYRGLNVLASTPTGAGGQAINDNLKKLADRMAYLSDRDPQVSDVVDPSPSGFPFAIGSRWFNTTSGMEWVCTGSTPAGQQPAGLVWQKVGTDLQATLDNKADKVADANGILAAFDAEGNLANSGVSLSVVNDEVVSVSPVKAPKHSIDPWNYWDNRGLTVATPYMANKVAVTPTCVYLDDSDNHASATIAASYIGTTGTGSFGAISLGGTDLATALTSKAPLASPTFIGTTSIGGNLNIGYDGELANRSLTIWSNSTAKKRAVLSHDGSGLTIAGSVQNQYLNINAWANGVSSDSFWTIGNLTSTATSGTTYALRISPSYNQVSSTASNTDILVNRTETAVGSGTQRLIDTQVNGVSKFSVDNTGTVKAGTHINLYSSGAITTDYYIAAPTLQTPSTRLLLNGSGGTNSNSITLSTANTLTATSGTQSVAAITPTYNQSGTAAGTDLFINRTEIATGSGSQNLIDGQVNGVSKFKVTTSGYIAGVGTYITGLDASNLSSGTIASARMDSANQAAYAIDPVVPTTNKVHMALSDPTIGEMALPNSPYVKNRLQFNYPLRTEYTTDGTIWQSAPYTTDSLKDLVKDRYDSTKISIPSPNSGGWQSLRVMWDKASAGDTYCFVNKLLLYLVTQGHSVTIAIEKSDAQDSNAWLPVATAANVTGWPTFAFIPHTNITWHANATGTMSRYVRVTISPSYNSSYPNNDIQIHMINWYGSYPANTQNDIWYWDKDRNVTYRGSIAAAGGYKSADGSAGWTGMYLSQDGKAVTVKNGIITNVA